MEGAGGDTRGEVVIILLDCYNFCVCVSRDGYGSDSDDSEAGGGGWDKSEEKRKRILDQFIESEFRKRRRVRNSILHYYIIVLWFLWLYI